MIKLVLQHQTCNVNVQDTEGATALMNVCRHGDSNFQHDLEIVSLLLKQTDIDVNIKKFQWSDCF